jgi:hypothetical protein
MGFIRKKAQKTGTVDGRLSRLPADPRAVIANMAAANRTWGEERIASELLLKLGISVSPRTVRRSMPSGAEPNNRRGSQAWNSFVRTHAR